MAKKSTPSRKTPVKPPGSRLKASKPTSGDSRLDTLYGQVREILTSARGRAWQAVNATMVEAYWEIGRVIIEEEQAGKGRADYGKRVVAGLSERLRAEFGKGYDRSNVFHMRAFFLAYPKVDALRRQLSWTHYRLLLRVDNADARAFYEVEAVNARWSTREMERQINSLLFERLALSRDKAGVMALAQKGHEISHPSDLVKDPLVLELTIRPHNCGLQLTPFGRISPFPRPAAMPGTETGRVALGDYSPRAPTEPGVHVNAPGSSRCGVSLSLARPGRFAVTRW
jgi:DUF1016 N-terminal domain